MSGMLFADLLDQMLILESGVSHFKLATPSDRAGDFAAVDALAEVLQGYDFDGIEGTIGFQYKFYPSESQPLSMPHKASIEESLRSVATAPSRPNCWILVTPEDFNKHQLEWLLRLRDKLKCDFEIRQWGQKRISALIAKHPHCAVHLYPDLAREAKSLTFGDMCSRLVQVLNTDKSHSQYYIDSQVTDGRTIKSALAGFLEGEQSLFCLLGTYGTGKTTALEHLTLQLARSYTIGNGERVPIFIKLRDVRGEGSFAHNVVTYIGREYGLEVDLTSLKALNAAGRIVLIMDGLDEKECHLDRRHSRPRLGEIFEFLSPNGKLIVSSRTEFFRDAVEEWNTVLGPYRPHLLVMRSRDKLASEDQRGVLAYTASLSRVQIEQYVIQRVGKARSDSLLEGMRNLYDLSDIARRIVLLEMICTVLPELLTLQSNVSVTDLYSFYVRQQLNKDIASSRMTVDVEDRLSAVRQLAEQMIISGRYQVHHEEVLRLISLPEGEMDHDFLNTAFLVRDGMGKYEFSHRSFMEYFGAVCMFRSLQQPFDHSELWRHAERVSREQYDFLDQLIAAEWERREVYLPPFQEAEDSGTVAASFVRTEQYSRFIAKTGFIPINSFESRSEYAKVCWYDAVAYVLAAQTRLPTGRELSSFLEEQWPHSHLEWSEIPTDSIFSCTGPDKEEILTSSQGAIVIRGEREWDAKHNQFGNLWTLIGDRRVLNKYIAGGSAAASRLALIRTFEYFRQGSIHR